MSKHDAETIADALRKRICLEPPGASPVLHEQALAKEFGVSRTPVRQALQRLAYERLVEVRSGIGTVVTPLQAQKHENDTHLASVLLRTVAEVEGDKPISLEGATFINVIHTQLSKCPSMDMKANYDMRARLMNIVTDEMSDNILADAVRAALWRLFRWRMAEAHATQGGIDDRLPKVVARMVEATQVGTVGALFEAQYEVVATSLKEGPCGRI